ncbi:MAG: serine dehydratase subunit alpha family protein [Candidatus Riflebacteria bacterium]|nr:serine dehydratase subunit alpha family protein [Candidatus Riflebacteria bacterium]
MLFSRYLAAEWRPALGCTEPAAIAHAAALAASQAAGAVRRVALTVDARTYKNCYAVGIPNSGHRTGILWALAIGAHIDDPSLGLECFRRTDEATLASASALLARGGLAVQVEPRQSTLWIDCTVEREGGTGRAVLAREHTRLARLEANGRVVSSLEGDAAGEEPHSCRQQMAEMSFDELIRFARSLGEEDRKTLRHGATLNVTIARRGLSLFPARFVDAASQDSLTRISRLVCAGVYARMSGEPDLVMSLAGSGNKGITCSVPLTLWGREAGFSDEQIDEALALACLVTSATTHHLGSLSAVCGCSNAAGIGLSSGLVLLEGGGSAQISLAVNNMVGNITGMICDGAKIGCALKTMTGVDAAFRSASLALSGIGIPVSDGIVGVDGRSSLANLGRIASCGMTRVDAEILEIMQAKLERQ